MRGGRQHPWGSLPKIECSETPQVRNTGFERWRPRHRPQVDVIVKDAVDIRLPLRLRVQCRRLTSIGNRDKFFGLIVLIATRGEGCSGGFEFAERDEKISDIAGGRRYDTASDLGNDFDIA